MKNSPKRRRHGFTLIEVLLVLVILVVLASFAVTAYGPMQTKAFMKAAKTQVLAFDGPLQAYRLDIGDFPSTAQGLDALRTPPADLPNPDKWVGPYLGKPVPPDPWDMPYQYEYPGKQDPTVADIWSLGPDGIDGSEDDVVSWYQE